MGGGDKRMDLQTLCVRVSVCVCMYHDESMRVVVATVRRENQNNTAKKEDRWAF